MGLLEGKTAFITGASRGIGKAICERFAQEGAAIAAAARSAGELEALSEQIASVGGKCVPITMDLTSEESIKNAVARAQSELSPIDILINNAGLIALGKIHETSVDTWDAVMSTNVRGVFLTCKEVLPQMMERKSGRIINVGSTAGRRGYEEQGAYCTSKHALVGLSKVLSIETQKYGIRVQMLSPGGVLTGMSRDLRASRGESEDSPAWITSEEIAESALYMCCQQGVAISDEIVLRRFESEPWR